MEKLMDAETLFDAAAAADDAPPIDLEDEASVKHALAGDLPLIADPPDPTVVLPRGYKSQTVAEVRELTGSDEERLARLKNQSEDEAINTLVSLALVRIGDIDLSEEPLSGRRRILNSLLLGERSLLFLSIIKATFGEEKELAFTCSFCDTENGVTLLLSEDFPIKFPNDNENLKPSYTFYTRKGQEVEWRLPVVADASGMEKIKTVPERSSKMLAEVVKTVDGKELLDPEIWVRNMGMADRQKFVEAIDAVQPYVDTIVKTECAACGKEQQIPLSWGDFLLP
jgi:hypothetical protein